jgi:hypothetical protein
VAHLRRAQHCDLMLDSALCNAHTSGTDALWAGTPMLTMPGETQTARVALSLLKAVAQPELAVASLRAFEDAATCLTADLTPITALTADLTPITALIADLTPITALNANMTPITALTADVDGAGAPRVWPRG